MIENRPGANGNIASEAVAKSAPDGYTLPPHADSGITINPHVYSKLSFDPLNDLLPVTSVATNQFMLSVNPELPVKTFQEFIEYAQHQTAAALCVRRERQPAPALHGVAQAAAASTYCMFLSEAPHRRPRPRSQGTRRCCSRGPRVPR